MLATVNQLRDIRGRRSLEILMNPRSVRDEKFPPPRRICPGRLEQSCPWVWSTHGLGSVGSGWVESYKDFWWVGLDCGSEFFFKNSILKLVVGLY